MPPLGRVDDAPPAFRRAVESLRAPAVRPEIAVEEIPAPKRLAPHAVAMSATVRPDGEDAAFGRLIVLYDPDGTRDWPTPFRAVVWVTSDLETEIASDPLLGQVAWSWLTEALEARQTPHPGLSGTVTRATTEGFAGKADQPVTTELELRASWSPEGADLSGDMQVWLDLLSAAAGLPPVDVADITQRRGRAEG
ncbi:DUF3000 domain-containing protein [Streptomonospora salina]|uniref:Enoyl-CoA hydratase n=1 Tax=Streptomonospora salina TaxID=104205 RepID=A0A841EKC4_9ACTN|nr:DUF3000 domain-containing protein [Streptomonospora salina]MBB6001228.1 hypothetical protein [Streptomonospora salina]